MRPRPDAAENTPDPNRTAAGPSASMRPRPDAAENGPGPCNPRDHGSGFNEAAARCRGKRRRTKCRTGSAGICFNEAAARCRGKPGRNVCHPRIGVASMRPRPDAAENSSGASGSSDTRAGFNEAAARCRGKPARRRSTSSAKTSFNEAAARCRGKPGPEPGRRAAGGRFNEAAARCRGKRPSAAASGAMRQTASMRPRPDAAENIVVVVELGPHHLLQ